MMSDPAVTGQRCPVGDVLRTWAQERPDRLCCAMDDERLTFAEMDARADRVAAGLAAIGVAKGDRVATLAPNRIELLELFHGCARAGAIQVPLNAYLKGEFLRHQLAQSRAKVIVVDGPGRAAIAPLVPELPDLEAIIQLDEPDGDIPYATVADAGGDAPAVDLDATDTMSILYTSGTTGLPKGCVLSHGYYCRSGEINAWALELTDDDLLFAALPLFHAGARLIVVMTALSRGIPAQIESAFSASGFFDRARRTKATVAIGVGAMGAALLASRPGPSDRAHDLRTMMVAPMAPENQLAFRERFGVEPWTEVFGQTECMPVTVTPISSDARDRSGCGLPAPDLELALLDDDGRPVDDGQVGEICVRGRGEPFATFDGYWTDSGAVTPAAIDGWHRTGDAGRRLPSGSLAFVDRKKDSLRRRGENISSIELEAAINTHPDVLESAVHAVPSDLAEDEIKACLVCRPGAELQPAEFFEFLKQHVPYFAIPRYVEIVDALPRNAVGRVMKHVLRERPLASDAWDYDALGLVVERVDRR